MASKQYPIIPLRNSVIFPFAVSPIAVGREKSLRIIEEYVGLGGNNQEVVLLSQRDESVADPDLSDLYSVGVLARIMKIVTLEASPPSYTIIVAAQERVRILNTESLDEDILLADFELLEETRTDDEEEARLMANLKVAATNLVSKSNDIPLDTLAVLQSISDPSQLTDFILNSAAMSVADKQAYLEEVRVNVRMSECTEMLLGQMEITEVSEKIKDRVRQESDKTQKEYYLRQQLKAIKEQLGTEDDDLPELETRIREANMPEVAHKAAMKQYGRIQNMQPSSSEYSVALSYIEVLLEVPWGTLSEDNLNLMRAQGILDDDHYGLVKVKERIVQFLAVLSLKSDMKGPILCLHGPPGTGKTSLARSVARSLGRKFARISLGGVHDESEIRGHRRTYVGAMPGRLVQAMIKAGTMNPVILLDEIDKVGRDMRGDPSAALLEVLDPEQNHTFADHYLDIELDLSKVLFIATANQLDTISGPLRDRMEIIDVPSYTSHEKQQIAQRYLIPKQVAEHGLATTNVSFPDDVVQTIINKYTREAGVRGLERRFADLCRNVAVTVAKTDPEDREKIHVGIDADFVEKALGPERYIAEVAQRTNMVGVVTGLAWTQSGGDILFIEAQTMPGKGEVKLTGQLGDVMKESVHAALSYIRANADQLDVKANLSEEKKDIHLHVPAGAIPKDGPSAGITMFTAIYSRLANRPVRKDVAMTGEITLSGNVLPVGGIKEKVIAAHRAGITTILMPALCRKDLIDVDDLVKNDITFHFISNVDEVLPLVFED